MILSPKKGFTLIEIMIVVAIIAISLSIAIPNLFRMSSISKRTVCVNNLKKITAAVEQWAIDNNKGPGDNISEADEESVYSDYLRGGKPKCPAGGDYVISSVGSNPQVQCTSGDEGHSL